MPFSPKKLRTAITMGDMTTERFISRVGEIAEQELGQVPSRKTILSWLLDPDKDGFHEPGRYLAVLTQIFKCDAGEFQEDTQT